MKIKDERDNFFLDNIPDENIVVCSPNSFTTFYVHNMSINQYKFFNILLFMINGGDIFKVNTYKFLDIETKKELLSENHKDIFVISLKHIIQLLGKNYNKKILQEQILNIKNLDYNINPTPFNYKNNIISKDYKISNFIDIEYYKDYIFVKPLTDFTVLKTIYKNYNQLNLYSILHLNSIYSMKIYRYINMMQCLKPDAINTYNNNFMQGGGMFNDYKIKLDAYDKNLDNFIFIDKHKISSIHIFDKIEYLLYILNADIKNFKYNISEFKFFIENKVCAELNNKFIEGLKFLYNNQKKLNGIKNNVDKYWNFPRYLVRCIWLKKHKLFGGNCNGLKHLIFQYYDILDIDFDVLFNNYHEPELNFLNFHKSEEN